MPSVLPSTKPSYSPNEKPSKTPSRSPSAAPSLEPSPPFPTLVQSPRPSSASSSPEPTRTPFAAPTPLPTLSPTATPTSEPTPEPTTEPTPDPTPLPTPLPTSVPTGEPSPEPTPEPSPEPTPEPTPEPSPAEPTPEPSPKPTPRPTRCNPCKWSNWSDWSPCSSICDGTRTRNRVCICPPNGCGNSCGGSSLDTDSCNESDGTIRFKSIEGSGDDWLYATDADVQADDMYYSYWKYCNKALEEQNTKECLERFCCGDNNDGTEDVRLNTCDGKKDQTWEIKRAGGNAIGSFYRIRNEEKDCCLDVFVGDPSSPFQRDVDCEDCDPNNSDQLWYEF